MDVLILIVSFGLGCKIFGIIFDIIRGAGDSVSCKIFVKIVGKLKVGQQ